MERVDSHMHLWRWPVIRGRAAHFPPRLRRSFVLADYAASAEAERIAQAVLVTAAHDRSELESLLALAAGAPIAGVVAWCDLTARSVDRQLDELLACDSAAPLVGVRWPLHRTEHDDARLQPAFARGLHALAERKLALDLLVRPSQAPLCAAIAERVPQLRIVVDHAGNPPRERAALHEWRWTMRRLSASPNVAVKLSGLFGEVAWPERSVGWSWVRGVADELASAFGSERMLFGSDWPVSALRHELGAVVHLTERLCDGLSPAQREAVWAGTARRWYGLAQPGEA